jgi:hypothetical protein
VGRGHAVELTADPNAGGVEGGIDCVKRFSGLLQTHKEQFKADLLTFVKR